MWLQVLTVFFPFIAGACSGLKVTVPSHTVHGIRGQALYLPVHYGFHTPASGIQIIWLFERSHTMPKYLLGSVNESVVPDLEYQHKFTMMPPNASLLINPLQFTDEGNYIVKVNIQGNGTLSSSQKIQVTVDGESSVVVDRRLGRQRRPRIPSLLGFKVLALPTLSEFINVQSFPNTISYLIKLTEI